MTTLVDTNVLIDVAYRDIRWHGWSRSRLVERFDDGLAINPVIFAEFCVRHDDFETAHAVLDPAEFRREHIPWEAAFAAGRAFRLYRQRGGAREKVLPDFLIGAHAAVRGYAILTRDPAGYRAYFPTVEVIAPDTHP
jgi:predicted nucleic acid-binding protein